MFKPEGGTTPPHTHIFGFEVNELKNSVKFQLSAHSLHRQSALNIQDASEVWGRSVPAREKVTRMLFRFMLES